VDQLQNCIDLIKTDPDSRRIMLCAWNPLQNDQMALPPCHVLCQFYVHRSSNRLSCHMYQRSADLGLGIPFNIASYALLTHMIAHVCGLEANELIVSIGDAHMYNTHITALQQQVLRDPVPFPKLIFNFQRDSIDDFIIDDFHLEGYNHWGVLQMCMAV
jgi:thymidylate synthase